MVKRSRNVKGGGSPSPLTPEEYKGVGTIPVGGDPNYASVPNRFPSNQVGGMCSKHKGSKAQRGGMSYGFANTADVPIVAGSYVPVTPMCTAKIDASRGGNNFMTGGKGRKRTQRGGLILLGGKRSKSKRSRTQRGGLILLGGRKSKRSKSKRSKSKSSKKTQKWHQKGCSKKK
jgi:hypothetical protein